ncbi:MAG: 50S ribosomal protein L3 [Candidatus Pacearchaeota archaeon]
MYKPRAGSLQYWPRKRAARLLPSANWRVLGEKYKDKKGLLGFICYKVGMARALSRDLTPDSMTKNKQIIVPLTVLECPSMRIFSVRFYKDNKVFKEVLADSPDKELKHKFKLPKGGRKASEILAEFESNLDEFNDIRVIVYNAVKQTGIKKTPDIVEIGLGGSIRDKFNWIKEHLNKNIEAVEIFTKGQLLDIHGVTKGHGFTGPIKRLGIGLRSHKAEKGRRRPGTLGPWHPARVTFRVAMAGQHGFFTRTKYNSMLLDIGNASKVPLEFLYYGKIKSTYAALKGSVQGPPKRQLLVTMPLRETKRTAKENFEIINILK